MLAAACCRESQQEQEHGKRDGAVAQRRPHPRASGNPAEQDSDHRRPSWCGSAPEPRALAGFPPRRPSPGRGSARPTDARGRGRHGGTPSADRSRSRETRAAASNATGSWFVMTMSKTAPSRCFGRVAPPTARFVLGAAIGGANDQRLVIDEAAETPATRCITFGWAQQGFFTSSRN